MLEQRHKTISRQLEGLGYTQILSFESVPLVEKLLADLVQTTSSLQKYMHLAKKTVEERGSLQIASESYRSENAKLVKECNDLHLTFLQYRQRNEKLQKDLKNRLTELESENALWNIDRERLKKRLIELEFECTKKGAKTPEFSGTKSVSTSALKSKPPWRTGTTEYTSAMALANQKCANLTKEIKKLKDEQIQLLETHESYKKQLNARDKEIERLTSLLETGHAQQTVSRDCCLRDAENRAGNLQEEVNVLRKEKCILEDHLKEAIEKQHEAMKRALQLCERNKQLENELRDIDQMALAVEQEANSTAKCNAERLNRLQEDLRETTLQLQGLEKEASELRRQKQELQADLNALSLEKKHLQCVLETALEEKKRMSDRVNQFAIIENDLNKEIDRLVQMSAAQKQKIAELEVSLLHQKVDSSVKLPGKVQQKPPQRRSSSPAASVGLQSPPLSPKGAKHKKGVPRGKSTKKSVSSAKTKVSQKINTVPMEEAHAGDVCYCCNENNMCVERLKELIDREIDQRQTEVNVAKLEMLQQERDYYMREHNRLSEQLKNIPSKPEQDTEIVRKLEQKQDEIVNLKREFDDKLNSLEENLQTLEQENKNLSQEKYNLMARLETARDRPDTDMEGLSLRGAVKRLERERELLKGDVQRLEEERDAIRHRLKVATETQLTEHSRLEKTLAETEDQVKRLEQERRELMQTQGSRRATISGLEDQCECLRQEYENCQAELTHVRTLYSQLKALNEQTDRALAESQGRIIQLESELAKMQDKSRNLDRSRAGMDDELSRLNSDLMVMKGNLAQLDKEKDALLIVVDDKTERVADMEQHLSERERKIYNLEKLVAELKQQLTINADNASSHEYMLKSLSFELENLKKQLDTAQRLKDGALQENKRLQDDLTSAVADCRRANHELDACRRQVEDLKRQLQHYVAEVKRTEDLITQKELERNELLDQFRSLSHEATNLENNNHTLESEASQSKVQLSVALEHAMDLERQMQSQGTLVKNYEKQISEMTVTIASLESQVRHLMDEYQATRRELDKMKDLCVKLDQEKEGCGRKLEERERRRTEIEQEIQRLKEREENLKSMVDTDSSKIAELEKLLQESKMYADEQMTMNESLKEEVNRLRNQMASLQDKVPPQTPVRRNSNNFQQQQQQQQDPSSPQRSPSQNLPPYQPSGMYVAETYPTQSYSPDEPIVSARTQPSMTHTILGTPPPFTPQSQFSLIEEPPPVYQPTPRQSPPMNGGYNESSFRQQQYEQSPPYRRDSSSLASPTPPQFYSGPEQSGMYVRAGQDVPRAQGSAVYAPYGVQAEQPSNKVSFVMNKSQYCTNPDKDPKCSCFSMVGPCPEHMGQGGMAVSEGMNIVGRQMPLESRPPVRRLFSPPPNQPTARRDSLSRAPANPPPTNKLEPSQTFPPNRPTTKDGAMSTVEVALDNKATITDPPAPPAPPPLDPCMCVRERSRSPVIVPVPQISAAQFASTTVFNVETPNPSVKAIKNDSKTRVGGTSQPKAPTPQSSTPRFPSNANFNSIEMRSKANTSKTRVGEMGEVKGRQAPKPFTSGGGGRVEESGAGKQACRLCGTCPLKPLNERKICCRCEKAKSSLTAAQGQSVASTGGRGR